MLHAKELHAKETGISYGHLGPRLVCAFTFSLSKGIQALWNQKGIVIYGWYRNVCCEACDCIIINLYPFQELQMHESDIGFFAPEYQQILGKNV